jgi:Ca2+-binding RTX toxin-like protein
LPYVPPNTSSIVTLSNDLLTEEDGSPRAPLRDTSRVILNNTNNLSHVTVLEAVRIEALGDESNGIEAQTASNINVFGRITSTRFGVVLVAGGNVQIGATGTIVSGNAVDTSIGGFSIKNNGYLQALVGHGIRASRETDVTNNGVIDAAQIGIRLTESGGSRASNIFNGGSIFATTSGIQVADTGSQVVNTGSVSSTAIGIELLSGAQGGLYRFTNSGLVTAAIAVKAGASDDDVANAGLLKGDIRLGAGNDRLNNLSGSIYGTIYLDDGDQPAGDDLFEGGSRGELVDGGGGDNQLEGGGGNDTLSAGAGDDVINGSEGRDRIDAGDGHNASSGGDGDDTLSGAGDDRFDGGDGTDLADFSNINAPLMVDLSEIGPQATGYGLDRFIAIENLSGGGGNDGLSGDASDNFLQGGGGADTIKGGGGDDTLDGGASPSDWAIYAGDAGVDVNLALQGREQDTRSAGFDTLIAVENLRGGDGSDALTGNGDNNRLSGGNGDDTLTGGGGSDVLSGGDGRNVAVFSGSFAEYAVTAKGNGPITVADLVDHRDGADELHNIRFGRFSDGIVALTNTAPKDIQLSAFIVGENSLPTTVVGTLHAKDDEGDALSFKLLSNPGNYFRIDGSALLVSGAIDYETVHTIDLEVEARDEWGAVSTRSFHVTVQDVNENVAPPVEPQQPSNPSLTPAIPDLVVIGTPGADALSGNFAHDKLYGLGGSDRLDGGAGNDMLYGGRGADRLWGGAGGDIFVFDTRTEKKVDVIADFDLRHESIWLDNAVFKKVGSGSAEMPRLLKKQAFHKGAKAHDRSDRIVHDAKKGALLYDADGTGQIKAVQFAKVEKGLALTHLDFFVI